MSVLTSARSGADTRCIRSPAYPRRASHAFRGSTPAFENVQNCPPDTAGSGTAPKAATAGFSWWKSWTGSKLVQFASELRRNNGLGGCEKAEYGESAAVAY